VQVVIAGSRGLQDDHLVAAAIAASGFDITEVLSGTCRGVDQMGERWGRATGVPITRFPADWRRLGRAAGPARNKAIIDVVASTHGALIAVWDGISPGTRCTIAYARQRGVPVYVHLVRSASAAS
jgi:hypothetical protein